MSKGKWSIRHTVKPGIIKGINQRILFAGTFPSKEAVVSHFEHTPIGEGEVVEVLDGKCMRSYQFNEGEKVSI